MNICLYYLMTSQNNKGDFMMVRNSQTSQSQIWQSQSSIPPNQAIRSKTIEKQNWAIIVLMLVVICLLTLLLLNIGKENPFQQLSQQETTKPLPKFCYPTLGVPTVGDVYNSTKVVDKDLTRFDQELISLLKPYNDTDCQFERVGEDTMPDGGYLLCSNLFKQTQGMINLGINGVDNFGCQLTTIHPFPNYQFDCTNPKEPQCSSNNHNNHFIYACIGAETEISQHRTFYTLEDMLKESNLTGKNVFIKMDCEGGEWEGLKYFPTEKLDLIEQIAMEIHIGPTYQEQWGMLDIMRSIMTKFVNVNFHLNNHVCFAANKENKSYLLRKIPAYAIEATFVNKRLINLKSETKSFRMHPLNKPNNPNMVDCQMSD